MNFSIVVPVYNEEDVLAEFHQRISIVLAELDLRSEIVYVNDGSTDKSLSLLYRLKHDCPDVDIVNLSRNVILEKR